MKTNMLTKTINNFIKKLMTENRFIPISPEIRKGNKELDEIVNNYYWNWEEYKN
jgi:hypothetical protein